MKQALRSLFNDFQSASMTGLGVANLVIAADFSVATWAWFISVVPVGAKAAAFAAQYLVSRTIIRRRIRGAAIAVPSAAA